MLRTYKKDNILHILKQLIHCIFYLIVHFYHYVVIWLWIWWINIIKWCIVCVVIIINISMTKSLKLYTSMWQIKINQLLIPNHELHLEVNFICSLRFAVRFIMLLNTPNIQQVKITHLPYTYLKIYWPDSACYTLVWKVH